MGTLWGSDGPIVAHRLFTAIQIQIQIQVVNLVCRILSEFSGSLGYPRSHIPILITQWCTVQQTSCQHRICDYTWLHDTWHFDRLDGLSWSCSDLQQRNMKFVWEVCSRKLDRFKIFCSNQRFKLSCDFEAAFSLSRWNARALISEYQAGAW